MRWKPPSGKLYWFCEETYGGVQLQFLMGVSTVIPPHKFLYNPLSVTMVIHPNKTGTAPKYAVADLRCM
jgi:hypothetical protein